MHTVTLLIADRSICEQCKFNCIPSALEPRRLQHISYERGAHHRTPAAPVGLCHLLCGQGAAGLISTRLHPIPCECRALRRITSFRDCSYRVMVCLLASSGLQYHLGFPLPGVVRKGRQAFVGSGRGLSYAQIAEVVRTHGGFEEVPAVWGGNKQTAQSPHNPECETFTPGLATPRQCLRFSPKQSQPHLQACILAGCARLFPSFRTPRWHGSLRACTLTRAALCLRRDGG